VNVKGLATSCDQEAEGKWALPQHEFGLDVMALAGALRYLEHRSVPEIHQQLHGKRYLCWST
jgi:hypothetical protein